MADRELYNKQEEVFNKIQKDVAKLREEFDEKMKGIQTGKFLDKEIAKEFFIRALDLYKKYESITHKDLKRRIINFLIPTLTRLYSDIALQFDLGKMTTDEANELLKKFPISPSSPLQIQELHNALTKKLPPPAEGGGGGGNSEELLGKLENVGREIAELKRERERGEGGGGGGGGSEAAQAQALAAKQIAEQAAAALQEALAARAKAEAEAAALQQQLKDQKAAGERLTKEAATTTKLSTDALKESYSLRQQADEGKRAAEAEARAAQGEAAAAEAARAAAEAEARAAQGEAAAAEAAAAARVRAAEAKAIASAEQAVIGEVAAARAEQEARRIANEINILQGELGENQRKMQLQIQKASEESRKAKSCEKELEALSFIVQSYERIQNKLSIALTRQAEREAAAALEAEAAERERGVAGEAERARGVAALAAAEARGVAAVAAAEASPRSAAAVESL
jgi:DNA repair exonuclease SbcCD ATPase subunit